MLSKANFDQLLPDNATRKNITITMKLFLPKKDLHPRPFMNRTPWQRFKTEQRYKLQLHTYCCTFYEGRKKKSCPIWPNFVKKCVPKMRLIARNGSYLFRVAAKITIQQSLYVL